MYLEIQILCSTGRYFEKWFQYQALTLTDFWQSLFICFHETEAGTECDHMTLNFEFQDWKFFANFCTARGSGCISLY